MSGAVKRGARRQPLPGGITVILAPATATLEEQRRAAAKAVAVLRGIEPSLGTKTAARERKVST